MAERRIDICDETERLWWNRFGLLFSNDVRRQRLNRMKGLSSLEFGPRIKMQLDPDIMSNFIKVGNEANR